MPLKNETVTDRWRREDATADQNITTRNIAVSNSGSSRTSGENIKIFITVLLSTTLIGGLIYLLFINPQPLSNLFGR